MFLSLALLFLAGQAPQSATAADLWLDRSAALALACVHKEYPNKIAHVLNGQADVRAPHELTPAFYGCYDWHSSVHGHWLLARVARLHGDAPFAARARAALDRSITVANIAAEAQYLNGAGRVSFERPYGLAWLLQLDAELHEWAIARPNDADVRKWATTLEPLSAAAVSRIADWLPKLTAPIRIGEHSQTAFSFGLMLDWARATGEKKLESLLLSRSRDFYLNDRACPLAYEPSGEDFLSPCVAEADLMRRVLPDAAFARWLGDFLPALPTDGRGDWLAPGVVTDPTDPKLGHLYGLNLSRAWMLRGIARSLPVSDPRNGALLAAARLHTTAGMTGVTGEHYEGGHWLGTFAVYLETGRGLPAPQAAQNLPMPGKPSDNLAAAKVFDYGSLIVTRNANGSERRDVVSSGRLATGEAVHIHASMQPPGTPPGRAHAIEHSEFIVVTEGTLEVTHDGRTEQAGPGSVIYIAYGTVHQARNAGPGPVRYTVIAIGGDAK